MKNSITFPPNEALQSAAVQHQPRSFSLSHMTVFAFFQSLVTTGDTELNLLQWR